MCVHQVKLSSSVLAHSTVTWGQLQITITNETVKYKPDSLV